MSVDPRWQRVQQLLEILEHIPPEGQEGHLLTLEPDEGLRAEVLAMADAMRREQRANATRRVPAADPLPETVGPYRIVQKLGSGGNSIVYMGIRHVAGVEQRVAVKVLRDHLQDAAGLARFKREQGILARLEHPAIARFLDAGADSLGRPYLVMECVDGDPIDSYCQRRSVSESDRLQLIVSVLDALHIAHQCLVVHLDLKPSNILVGQDGQVKIVDFGTAKLLESQLDWTTTRQLTPSFASPEQLRGDAVSTLSDLYSVGLTLQRLVSGGNEGNRQSAFAAIAARAYGGAEIRTATIRRDLDAVIFKALAPDGPSRYQSAADFAADLRAILDRRPVQARKPTLPYRVERFVARNRGTVSLMGMLVLAVLLLGGNSLYQYTQRTVALKRSAAIADFLRSMIESSSTANSGRSSVTVLEMIQQAVPKLESSPDLPLAVQAVLQSGFAYVAREAGREDLARVYAESALKKADQSGEPAPRLQSRQTLAEILVHLGNCPEAVRLFGEADALWAAANRQLRPEQLNSFLVARGSAKARCEASPQAAVESYQQALAVPALRPKSIAATAVVYALELARLGRNAEALRIIDDGLKASRQDPEARYFEVALERMLSQVERKAAAPAKALAAIDRAIRLAPGRVNRFEELRLRTLRAGILAELGQAGEARDEVFATLAQSADAGVSRWMLFADGAEVLAKIGDCVPASKYFSQADALLGKSWPRDWLGNRLYYSAECAIGNAPAEASRLAKEALAAYGDLLGPKSERRSRLEKIADGK